MMDERPLTSQGLRIGVYNSFTSWMYYEKSMTKIQSQVSVRRTL